MNTEKSYTWLSYSSILLTLFLIVSFFVAPIIVVDVSAATEAVIGWLFIVGLFVCTLVSVVALSKKNEKKLLSSVGLILSIIIIVIYLFMMFVEIGP